MSRLEQQFKDLRIITGTDPFIDHTPPPFYALNTSRSTRSVNPLYTTTPSGINQSYMLLTSPNRNRSTQNLQLSVPKATSPLSKGSSSKLKKHISFINNSFNYPKSSLTKHHTRSITTTTTPSYNIITSYKNRPPVNVDNNKFEFSARTYMMNSPTSRAIPSQPLFRAAKTKNAFALFKSTKPSSTTTTTNAHHNNNNMFNHSARNSYYLNTNNNNNKRKEMLINTNIYADKIKHKLKHGSYHEPSTNDNDVGVFAKELKAWSNKKENEWKQLQLY